MNSKRSTLSILYYILRFSHLSPRGPSSGFALQTHQRFAHHFALEDENLCPIWQTIAENSATKHPLLREVLFLLRRAVHRKSCALSSKRKKTVSAGLKVPVRQNSRAVHLRNKQGCSRLARETFELGQNEI